MAILINLQQLLKGWKKSERPGVIRQQHCITCRDNGWDIVLAAQLTDKVEATNSSDYYVVDNAMWLMGEPYLLYRKEKWFGNNVMCPVCGKQVKLPIDKPLAYEQMQESREERKNDN